MNLHVVNRYPALALVVLSAILFLTSCDSPNGPGNEEELNYSFEYKVFDENGGLLSVVSDKQVDENPIKASAGYFGYEFFPPWLLESIPENSPIDPESVKENQIYLIAETDLPEPSKTYSLRISFPDMQQWETGEYQLPNIPKEKHMELLRIMWELRQNNPFPGKFVPDRFKSNEAGVSNKMASVDYSETGFMTSSSYGVKIDSTGLLYRSTKGVVELTHTSDKVIEGSFTVELTGFPMEIIFFSDEFPENPELQMFTITGNFTAIPGDYDDLVETSESFL